MERWIRLVGCALFDDMLKLLGERLRGRPLLRCFLRVFGLFIGVAFRMLS